MASLKIFDIAGSGMAAESVRLNTVASNIANVSTPGYKRVDLGRTFEQELIKTIDGRDAAKIAALDPLVETDSLTPSTRADGNNVQLDSELLKLTTNTMNFDALSQFASGSLKQLRTAITGRPA